MGGGLLQLVAYGAQDVYLTGNPQITFWKVSYRRYTNFSMEAISQTFSGTASFGGKITCQISRNGDLIHRMYLEINSNGAAGNTPASIAKGGAYLLVNSVEVEIGGQKIDKQYGDWMYIWNKLTLPAGKYAGIAKLTAFANTDLLEAGVSRQAILPLEFWFCRNPGLALPLIALQYHEVKINVQFNGDADISKDTTASSTYGFGTVQLWVDYIFLDTDERRRMAQNPHEYLIDQLQFTGQETLSGTSATVRLNFNHPVKELVWVGQVVAADSIERVFRYAPITEATLQLNGQDRFEKRNATYFNSVQPLQHHSNVPMDSADATPGFTVQGAATSNINVYSFALRPEEHQPSGTCNFSRIDSAVLKLNYADTLKRLRVYAVNYNVLRIMSGMGGLAYSN